VGSIAVFEGSIKVEGSCGFTRISLITRIGPGAERGSRTRARKCICVDNNSEVAVARGPDRPRRAIRVISEIRENPHELEP
jgi:hypothetical protein